MHTSTSGGWGDWIDNIAKRQALIPGVYTSCCSLDIASSCVRIYGLVRVVEKPACCLPSLLAPTRMGILLLAKFLRMLRSGLW